MLPFLIAEPIPMKRELKLTFSFITRRYPSACFIAEPIPMKRELKLLTKMANKPVGKMYCRAYPDEKGIETICYCPE